ncbi:WD repeat-containing protein 91 [Neocloeon triangulifer]|uniref:WD repeat-containing protein 91 n=1 Tax=Neocloeon triangulifer TaxID=2078957 RepID=UPI00286F42AF|nr:WD repeat-containing protein 91 [Neocloeon triangulifer]
MSHIQYLDELVKEYLLFRGFCNTLKAFDGELKTDKDKGFRADKIVDQIVLYVNFYDLTSLRELWAHLDQRMFSKLESHFAPAIRKLETSVLKYYVVNTISNNKNDKLLDFFNKMASELQGQSEWKDWFALPYIRNPEESHIFAVFFTRHWQDTLLASLHNFLAIIFQSIPLPTLASFEDEAVRMRRLTEEVETLKSKLSAVGFQDLEGKSSAIESSRTELMDDFYIIGKRETVTAVPTIENQSLSLKSIMRNISGGIPTSPILGRKQQQTSTSSRRVVSSSSMDEKRSSSKTRISTQRSIGADVSSNQKVDSKSSPKPKEDLEAAVPPKIPEGCPFLLLSQEWQEFHNSAITQCKFNNSGSLVASGDADGVVKVWLTSPAPKVIATFQCKANVVAIDWLGKHERFFILGTKAGSIYLCDSAEKKIVWELGNQPGSPLKDSRVLYVCCSPSEPQIVCSLAFSSSTSSGDYTSQGKLFLLDVKTRKLERSLSLIGDSSRSVLVGCCTYNHNGQLLVAGATDGVVRIFDIRKGECVDSWLAHDGSVLSLQLSYDFTSCFTLGQDGKFCQRNLNQSGHRVWETMLPEPLASGIHGQLFTFEQSGRYVLMCGRTEDCINQITPQGLSLVLSLGMNKGGGGQGAFSTAVDWCSANDCSTCIVGMSDGKIKISTLLQQ